MSQCVVPSWDLDGPPPLLHRPSAALVPLTDGSYDEVAELTWQNGQLALHGHAPSAGAASWAKLRGHRGGTLESLVHQATGAQLFAAGGSDARAVPRDAEVPAGSSGGRKRGVCSSQGSAPPPVAPRRRLRDDTILHLSFDTHDEVDTTATYSDVPDDNESENLSKSTPHTKRDGNGEEKGKENMRDRSKSKAAIIHNQSERKRRDRINQKMKTLQKLVPNSSKTDKASILDEVIDYMKQLQAQVEMMNRMSSMMLPMPMPQIQMSMMANMAQMAQMGVNSLNRPPLLHPSPFLPLNNSGSWDNFGNGGADRTQQTDPFSAFLAYQNAQQPMTLDAYNRMSTLFQQLYQQKPQNL